MSTRTTVTFNGTDLTASDNVSDLRRPLLPRTAKFVSVPGRDGALYAGVTENQRKLVMTMTCMGDPEDRAESMRTLAKALRVTEAKPLAISEDGGLYYMAIPTSNGDGERYVNAESFDVEFTCDPWLYGDEKTETLSISSGGTKTFTVTGSVPTPCLIEVTATASGDWTLTLDDGYFYQYPSVGGSKILSFDAERRIAQQKASASAAWSTFALPATCLAWFVLTPGQHTLKSTGGSTSGTLKYRERWA